MVLPENRDAVLVFIAASTQWRIAPGGGLAGLDYSGARSAADALGADWGAVFGGLRVMESAALDALTRPSRPA